MVLKSDKEKVKTLLSETIRLLCKNGLPFRTEFSIEALVGITLDKEDEFFLSIREIVKSDIVTSTDMTEEEVPSPKKARRREKEGQPRKRSAATVTARSQGDVTNLSLGDMQDSAQSFWGSVTDGESQQPPLKMRHIDDSDDESDNEAQVTIKGEPGSDSDLEVTSHETPDRKPEMTTQQQFVYNVPSQSQMSMPQSGWDQMGQYTSMAGTSGINTSQGATPGMDGQQVGVLSPSWRYSEATINPSRAIHQKSTEEGYEYRKLRLYQRILLSKGREITPRAVMMNMSGREKAEAIIAAMKELTSENLGCYSDCHQGFGRKLFLKRPVDEIREQLVKYGVDPEKYETRYFMPTHTPRGPKPSLQPGLVIDQQQILLEAIEENSVNHQQQCVEVVVYDENSMKQS